MNKAKEGIDILGGELSAIKPGKLDTTRIVQVLYLLLRGVELISMKEDSFSRYDAQVCSGALTIGVCGAQRRLFVFAGTG